MNEYIMSCMQEDIKMVRVWGYSQRVEHLANINKGSELNF